MKIKVGLCAGLALLLTIPLSVSSAQSDAEKAAMEAMDAFMKEFNARDADAWAATLNFPHVRLAQSDVRVWETAKDYADDMDFDRIAATGWHHSEWTERKIVQQSDTKVHIAVKFTRFNADNEVIGVYDSFYVVTQEDGHWGVKARSSFL